MDIAQTAMTLKQGQLQMQASFALASKVKETAEQQGDRLIDMLSAETASAPHPDLGNLVDISV